MKLDSRWMWIGGVLAAAVLALVAGIPPGTLLIVAALLACPAAMYFGMRGHQNASGMSRDGGIRNESVGVRSRVKRSRPHPSRAGNRRQRPEQNRPLDAPK